MDYYTKFKRNIWKLYLHENYNIISELSTKICSINRSIKIVNFQQTLKMPTSGIIPAALNLFSEIRHDL